MTKKCLLYDRDCIDCGDCRCELDPSKICDNCFRCLDADAGEADGYRKVPIAKMYLDQTEYVEHELDSVLERVRTRYVVSGTLYGCRGRRLRRA